MLDSIGPQGASKVARDFWVEQREAPFMYEGHYYTAERIRSLLVASVETETRFIGAERRRLSLNKHTKAPRLVNQPEAL